MSSPNKAAGAPFPNPVITSRQAKDEDGKDPEAVAWKILEARVKILMSHVMDIYKPLCSFLASTLSYQPCE